MFKRWFLIVNVLMIISVLFCMFFIPNNTTIALIIGCASFMYAVTAIIIALDDIFAGIGRIWPRS